MDRDGVELGFMDTKKNLGSCIHILYFRVEFKLTFTNCPSNKVPILSTNGQFPYPIYKVFLIFYLLKFIAMLMLKNKEFARHSQSEKCFETF